MNEQAILDSYNLFVKNGYKDSIEDFKKLIASNSQALTDSYNLFKSNGYGDSVDDYKALMGLTADKKKVATESPLEGGSLALPKIKPERAVADATMVKPQMLGPAPKKGEEKASYLKTLYDNLALGASYINEAVVSLPETVINTFAIPQNYIAEKTGWNIGTNADQIKKQFGIKNPLLDYVQENQKIVKGDVAKDVADRYGSDPGIVSNFQKGNYQAGFELLGASIVNSAPLSLAMMYGGAVAAPETMMALTTLGLTENQRKELEEMDPTMKESEKMMKALGMSAAESVFESLGTRTIGTVYRDIAAKEGKEAAKDILKNGLVTAYKKALEKTGPVAGFAGEGLEEAATQITQNVISGRPTFEGVADAFATGAGSGVVYTAPISAVKAKQYIQNKVETYQTKDKIGNILKDNADNIDKIYNVPVASEITPEQIEVANLPKSRNILVNNLKKNVDNGNITEDDAKQSLYVFDKIQQVSNSVKDLDVSTEDKAKIATLLKQRDALKTDIQNKDDVLVVEQKKQIEEINNNIQSIITKSKENAIQKPSTDEGLLRSEEPGLELPQVGEGNKEPQVAPAGPQETIAPQVPKEKVNILFNFEGKPIEDKKQIDDISAVIEERIPKLENAEGSNKILQDLGIKVQDETAFNQFVKDKLEGKTQDTFSQWVQKEEAPAPSVTRVNIAPFFNTTIKSVAEAEQLRQTPEYKTYIQSLNDIGKTLGIPVKVADYIGGYENRKGEKIVEISNLVDLEGATMEQAEEFAALASTLAPQVQESAIAASYTNQGDKNHNANKYSIMVSDVNGAIESLKEAGITDFSIDPNTGEVSFIDLIDFTDPELQANIGTFIELLKSKGINYEQQVYRPVNSKRVGIANRKAILGRIKSKGTDLGPSGQVLLSTIEEAVRRDAEFQGVNREEYFQPRAGNRLFNKPLTGVTQIANRYYERVFGKEKPKYYGSEKIDEARAKRIADAFDKMKHDPNNPRVKAAYEAMAKETLDQYKDFLDAGYTVEINNDEPYRNSQEMIDDLRNNKRMKIFSTESGFGDNPITEQQRKENPLLRDSGYKDANGQPMLINDVFRAIHDFYGHAELGNSFGPKGEENAWNVHARMFSPLARAAMTTETRGQNSYVNFSGVNDATKELQKQARALREEGLNAQARKIEEQIYQDFKFADQKIGLLPEEFYQIDEANVGDEERVGIEELMTADTKDATVLQKVYDFLDKLDSDLEKFGKETAGVNIPIPIMRAIIKSVKALVKTGITLQEAIRKTAIENKVSEQDVMDSINALTEKRAVEGKPEGVTEMELPGYNRMIRELEGIIQKSVERGVGEEKIMQNAMDYLQGSKVYQDASDTQRERMVRDVRKMFGKREKAAPKPEKLFGEIKDVKQITMSEYDLYKQQLKDEAKGAKNAISLWKKTSGALASYLKKMADGGYLTAKQTAAVLRKFSSVNMLDDNSINRFVDYMQKVFKNADYAEQIAQVNAMLPTAKKNIQNKIGTSQTLFPLLKQLFSIKPTLIPDAVFDKYVGIVEMMGERKAVLNLDEYGKVTDTVDEILDAVDEEVSRSEELSELFNSYPDKIVDEDGKVDFTGTIKKMLENEEITEKDAEIMRKYKSSILPMIQKEKKSDEEIAAEKEVLVDAVKSSDIDFDGLAMKDERNLARELERLIKTDAVNGLDNAQLNNLLRVIDNINNGYMPHYGELMVERLNAINNSKTLEQSVDKADPLTVEEHYAKLKSLITRKEKLSELIRRNPQYFIDQVFGDFKTKNIFNSVFEKPAEAQSLYKSAVNEVRTKLEEAKNKVSKSFNYDGNKLTMSSFKMMTYLVQLEYESNPGSKQVNPASEYLKTTIEHIKDGESRFGLRDAKMLDKILKDYSDADGNIDKDKLYNSFNPAEKNAIKTVQKINEDNTDKAIYTAAIIRGDRIHPLNNYVHLNVLHDYKPEESFEGASSVSLYSNSRKPSTKAKSLIERTGKVSPLDFDVFASASRGANFTLMDYYLTEPIRTARKTFNETAKLMKEKMKQRDAAQKEKPLSDKAQEKQDNEDQLRRDIFNAIRRAFDESVDDVLVNNITSTSFGDEVSAYMTKQGYRAVLASVPRFISELTSNIGFVALAAPKEMKVGIDNRDISFSNALPKIMKVAKSKQINRLFPHDTVSGRLVDTSILEQAGGAKGGRSRNDVANKILQINDLSLKKYVNSIELIADALVSTPDKLIMRPLWTGSFISEFKKITGEDVDLDKIENEDEKYIAANQEAINKARDVADEKSILAGATDNAFMGVLKGKKKPNQSIGLRAFNMFNNFMTNFIIYEYSAARKGIYAAMGNGDITKKQGIALMAAVATRTTLYTVLLSVLAEATVSLFVDDEDKDDEKSLLQKFGQSIASSATSLFLGRNFGNATKALVNQGVEYMNEKYLDFLRKGDYDPYKDAIQYTIMPPESKGKQASYQDMLMNMMGPFGPSMKTSELIFRKATEPPKKEAAAKQRVEKEKNIRIPLEVLGNLGMIPLYKDVRKIVNKEIYKDLDKAEKKQPMNKIGKEDMKKYFPQMYNELYGPGGALYDVEQMKKEMRKEKEKMKQQIKNEMYR